jgi:hypothetical protein
MRWLFLVAFAGCGFTHGSLDQSGPGSDSGMMTIDGAAPDVLVPPDARTCFGNGLATVCLASAPMQPLVLTSGTLDTGVDGNCTQVISQMCVLAGSTVDVPTGITVTAVGSRPLVIVAATTLTVTGTIDVSSRRTPSVRGAGSNGTPCTVAGEGVDESNGSSGGAGGSFGAKGGNGGNGNTNFAQEGGALRLGGTAGNATVPTAVRGGCAGAKGGDGNSTNPGGPGGASGGAVYLIAGGTIDVAMAGRVFASGAGGGGGDNSGGGGGGGSGGLVGLEAPTINMAGIVAANSGAGGGGGGNDLGVGGGDGTTEMYMSAAIGGGGSLGRGDGGSGSSGATTAGTAGDNSDGGGGGGGGGAGVIWVKGTLTGTRFSPAASLH